MGWFDSIFNPGKAYEKAGKEYEKKYNEAQGYLKPYADQGQDQYSRLNNAENSLLDPSKLQNEWSQGYEMSPYAQQMQKQAMGSGMDAASSMGLLGSSTALNNMQQGSSNIMQKDRQQYMNDLMQKYISGLGIGQNIYNQGAGASGQMSQNAMGAGENMGKAAFGQQNAGLATLEDFLKIWASSQQGGGGAAATGQAMAGAGAAAA